MADQLTATYDAPLGVGGIVSDSFSILFRNFILVMILALVPTLLGIVIGGLLGGWNYAVGDYAAEIGNGINYAAIALNFIIQMVVYGIATALLVQLAYDSKLNRGITPQKYIGPAFAAAIPIAVLGLVIGILAGIGFMALIIPGLWIYAVFSMTSPSIVIEKVGYRGMGRSKNLTKGYRWPILGVIIIISICAALVGGAVGFALVALMGGGSISIPLNIAVNSIAGAFGTGLGGIAIALTYARLREIKEGVSVDEIASVFD